MKNKLILTAIIFTQIFAHTIFANEIARKDLRFDTSNDYIDRLNTLENEFKELLGRMEIIEHKMQQLTIPSRVPSNISGIVPTILPDVSQQESPQVDLAQDGLIAADVFDVTTKKNINTVIDSKSDITKDKQLYDLALAALKDNKLPEAEEKFSTFIKNYVKSPLLSNAYFWYGEVFFRNKKFNDAAINYLKSYNTAPKGAKASDSLFKLSLALGELKRNDKVCAIIAKLELEFPSRPSISIKRTKDTKLKYGCK